MFIDDTTGTLSAGDRNSLEVSAPARMDVKIVIASTGSRAELDASVGRLVNSGNTLAIGIDPVHHYTFTHFGVGLGIASSEFQGIAHAGNADFKAGHWAEGLRSIMASASLAQRQTVAAQTPIIVRQPTMVVEHPVSAAPFVIGGLVLAALAGAVWMWLRRRQAATDAVLNDFRDEAQQMRTRNVEEQGWHDRMKAKQEPARPVDPPPAWAAQRPTLPVRDEPPLKPRTIVRERIIERAPATTIVQQSGGNDILTGILIGEAVARPAPVEYRPARHHTPVPEPSSSSSSSWDSGGSSSWDSGSGGGGFDSGGGGFDGGSGGGDF